MHLFSTQIQWMMFMRTLMVIIKAEEDKFFIVFDDMTADIMTNEIFQSITKRIVY